MTSKYGSFRFFVLLLILTLFMPSFSFAGNENPYVPSYTTYDTTYDAIIKMYIRVINGEDKGRHDLFNDLIYEEAYIESKSKEDSNLIKRKIGYCIDDINYDGQDELIIEGPYSIYEIFTIHNGKVRELIRAGYRYVCFALDNGYLYRRGSSGAASSSDELWKMNGTGKVSFVEGYHSAPAEYENLPDYPDSIVWYHDISGWYAKDQIVSLSEVSSWVALQEEHIVHHSVIPLAVYEQYSDRIEEAEQIGILTVSGKTSGGQTVNVRSKPSKSSKILQKSRVGTYVLILGEEDGYYHVVAGKKEGYIQQDYVGSIDSLSSAQHESLKSADIPVDVKPVATASVQPTIIPDPSLPTPGPVLRKGSQGQEVKDLQTRLSALGFYPGKIDGVFDEGTEEALVAFQKTNQIVENGILDENTRQIMFSVNAKPYSSPDTVPSDAVVDHYEMQEVERSRQVLDHYETYYTYEDDGNGQMIEVPHERPVYRTEYYTVTQSSGSASDTSVDSIVTAPSEPVLDHYEEVEVQRSRRVVDHYEIYYTYEDDGNGQMIEVPHERPVYKTEYYTETVQMPVYK